MKKQTFDSKDIRTAVKTIKTAILKSRYMAARKANFEHLKLYFYVGAYVSANSRSGTWGTGAIAAISERLSLELPGLRGFSPTNIKNMRIFSEQWTIDTNRQLPTGDLTESDFAAFFSIGFTHHMEIIFKCRSLAERWYCAEKPMNDFDEYLVAGEPDKRERAYGWATAIGLQDGDGLKVSDFLLNTAKRNIEGEITHVEEKSREGNLAGYIGYSEIDAMSNQMEKEKR